MASTFWQIPRYFAFYSSAFIIKFCDSLCVFIGPYIWFHSHPTTYISAPLHFFESWHAVTKTTTKACIDEVSSCYVLVWEASGHITVYTTKGMWSNASQTTSASGLSDWITMCLDGCLHLYLALSTCDPIAQDTF